jgi:hypothetical protein
LRGALLTLAELGDRFDQERQVDDQHHELDRGVRPGVPPDAGDGQESHGGS